MHLHTHVTPTRPRLPVWRTRRRGVGPGQAGCGSQQRSNRLAHCVPGVRVRVSDNNNSLVLLLFFCIFIDLWPRMFGQWMFGVWMWRVNWLVGTRGGREDPESIIDRIAAEMVLNLLQSVFLCGCAATLWTQNVVQDWSWFKTLF